MLREELRLLYALEDPVIAPAHLDAWLAWASRSRLAPFAKLAPTIRRHRAGILAAIRLGFSDELAGRKHNRSAGPAKAASQKKRDISRIATLPNHGGS